MCRDERREDLVISHQSKLKVKEERHHQTVLSSDDWSKKQWNLKVKKVELITSTNSSPTYRLEHRLMIR